MVTAKGAPFIDSQKGSDGGCLLCLHRQLVLLDCLEMTERHGWLTMLTNDTPTFGNRLHPEQNCDMKYCLCIGGKLCWGDGTVVLCFWWMSGSIDSNNLFPRWSCPFTPGIYSLLHTLPPTTLLAATVGSSWSTTGSSARPKPSSRWDIHPAALIGGHYMQVLI